LKRKLKIRLNFTTQNKIDKNYEIQNYVYRLVLWHLNNFITLYKKFNVENKVIVGSCDTQVAPTSSSKSKLQWLSLF
jgi:cytochrome c oxidase assembly protein Cox11